MPVAKLRLVTGEERTTVDCRSSHGDDGSCWKELFVVEDVTRCSAVGTRERLIRDPLERAREKIIRRECMTMATKWPHVTK